MLVKMRKRFTRMLPGIEGGISYRDRPDKFGTAFPGESEAEERT